MPGFAYRILDVHGAESSGVLEAADLRQAAGRLRAGRACILELRAADRPGPARRPARIRYELRLPLPAHQTAGLFRQLALMLRSGLPVVQALNVVADHSPNRRLARMAGRLAGRIQAGAAFSAALAEERGLVPGLAVRMAATGEATGELDDVLERVATELERQAALRSTLLTSLAYPAVVVLMTIGVVAFLVGSVIPKFAHILQGRNIALPASTRLLIGTSEWLGAHAGAIVLVAVLAVCGMLAASRFQRTGAWLDAAVLRLPLIGGLLTLAAMAQLGRSLSVLLRSGVPLLESLRLLRESFANRVIAARIALAETGIIEGRPLSSLLRGHPLPAMVPELIAVGEISGSLEDVLAGIGDHHEDLLRRRVRLVSQLVEPAMILVVGGIVGFVYIAFFQALFQMSSR